jgi:hypothetical protein
MNCDQEKICKLKEEVTAKPLLRGEMCRHFFTVFTALPTTHTRRPRNLHEPPFLVTVFTATLRATLYNMEN